MIPILYEKNETAFSSNGICRLRDTLSCIVIEERNGVYECNFDYPVTGAHYEQIVCGRIIAVTHDDTGDIQPFDIVGYTAPINGVVSFHAVHISYRLNYITCPNVDLLPHSAGFGSDNPKNIMLQAIMPIPLRTQQTTPSCPFTFESDITTQGFLTFEDSSPLTLRQIMGGKEGGILDRFHCEFEFDRWTVRMWSNRGQQRDFVIRYGLNLTEYNDEADTSEVFNRVFPYWKKEDSIVIADTATNSGKTIPSGRVACVPLDLSSDFENAPTSAQLTSKAQSYMNTNKTFNPAETIKVSFVRLQDSEEYEQYRLLMQCGLCDTITVKFPMYNMSARMKIVKVVWNVLQERYDSMELGELSTTLSQALGVSGGSSYSGSSGGGGGGLSINDIYPVGSIYMSVNSANPSTLFAGTTWERITGKFLLGATDGGSSGGNSTASVVAGGTGGEAAHTLQANESGLKSHSHNPSTTAEYFVTCTTAEANNTRVAYSSSGNRLVDGMTNTSTSVFHHRKATDSPSSAATAAHNNMPPFLSVYIWKRTA